MKNIVLLFCIAALVSSCASTNKPMVGLTLSDVNGKENSHMSYIDDDIAIDWSYTYKSKLNFKLKNLSDNKIKVIWDEVVYVNPDGSTDRVMHAGVKYVNRNESQPPTVIPVGSFIEDAIIPTSVVSFVAYVGWAEGSLFNVSSDKKTSKWQLENTYGKNVKVIMPIEIGDNVADYTFTFTVLRL